MSTTTPNQINSNRELHVPVELLYQAFANPLYLKEWWGPEGFTNTIHEFDLRPGGNWKLTMHGPEKGNYENAAIFTAVEPQNLVSWTRQTQPLFDMTITFEKTGPDSSRISFIMHFKTIAECEKMKIFVIPKNEENFNRLERLLNLIKVQK
ncbi:MAG: SRPBCC domain-containing protein [Bacteroidia bacterium]